MFNVLRFRQNMQNQPINFMKYKWLSAIVSGIIFAAFFGTYIYKYTTTGQTFNYSVDFTGGVQALLSFNKPVHGEQLVHILDKAGWTGAITREFSQTEHLIRVKKETKDVTTEANNIKQALEKGLGSDFTIEVKGTDSVGGAVGANLWTKSFYAIIISLVLMLLYIALRFFSFSFAMGAIVSLFHDAIVILAFFLIFNKEISINVIGAILAVLGYSINDTIVIFARIRDNLKRLKNVPIAEVINISITETLSRTILTTFATLLVVVALLLFGGEALRDLSLALLIGIAFGIYSTIFIATPVLLMLYRDKRTIK